MNKYIKSFFKPGSKLYTYHQSKEIIVKKVEGILSEQITFFGIRDLEGYFINKDTFTVKLRPQTLAGILYNSTLSAEIKETSDSLTEIKIKVRPGFLLFIIFFLTLLFGIFYFYESTPNPSLYQLLSFIGISITGPIFSIVYSIIANAALVEQFDMYIDNKLKK